jgi:hypothetical protein
MFRGQNHKKTFENQRLTEVFCLMLLVPGTGLNSRMNKGFAWVWGIISVPHKKFHFGVSRAQQVLSGKASSITLVSVTNLALSWDSQGSIID